MAARKLVVALTVAGFMSAALLSASLRQQEQPSGQNITAAATEFLITLDAAQKAQATFAFDDAERLNWHFIPRERKGLPVKSLEGAPLKAALTLLRSGLSEAGYDQALNVMSLEEVLYLLEGGSREERRAKRDPKKYFISIFGTPGPTGTWGWRFEGHHLSLNYTIQDGKVVSSTPEFFGANPGLIDAGPERKIRVLGAEEDIARQILKQCSPEQLKKALVDAKAPGDIRSTGTPQPETSAPVGLPGAEMSADQKRLLAELLNEYLRNMPSDVVAERRERIGRSGIDAIHFAWWGSSELNGPHAYTVQGPTFLIEYNNTQNSANHVHSIWRSMDGDFNIPVRKQ